MSATTAMLTDIGTVITNGPNAATTALALAAAGPIIDYPGSTLLAKLKMQETLNAVNIVKSATDATDSANLALLNKLIATFNGTSTPSNAMITDIGTVITNGPNAATTAKAIAAAGAIMDYPGFCLLVRTKLREIRVLLLSVVAATDATDSANKTLLQNINLALV